MRLKSLEISTLPPDWELILLDDFPFLQYRKDGVWITIEERPPYCDRGNWIAKITKPGLLLLDMADGWPRYYFNLLYAFEEIDAFLKKREELNK